MTAAVAAGLPSLAEIAAKPPGPERDTAALDAIQGMLAEAPDDEVLRQRIRTEVRRLKLMPLGLFDATTKRTARVAHVFDEPDAGPGKRPAPDGMRPVPGSPGWGYRAVLGDFPGDVWQYGREGWAPVLGWAPAVPRFLETPSPDGSGATAYYYEISAGGRSVLASGDELTLGEPWKLLPVTGTGAKRVREVLANVVLAEAARVPIGRALSRTGWHRDESGADRYFVFADGRTSDGREVVLTGRRHYARLAAAARPVEIRDIADVFSALMEIAEHGRGPGLAGVGIGVRALGHSLHKVPGGFIAVGAPNAGKSSLGWHARCLMAAKEGRADAWPPLPSATFADTKTIIEGALDYEADMPTLLDDAPINEKSSRTEVSEVTARLEMVFRALANDSAVRGRMDRTMLPRDPNYVRSPVIATMQGAVADIPLQNSLLRRVALLPVVRGDIDTTWYRGAGNAASLVGPLRSLGEHYVITFLSALGDPAGYLAAMDAEAGAMLAAALEVILPGWEDNAEGLAGVVDVAACALSGLLIACAVCDISPGIFVPILSDYLASAVAGQARRMGDSAEEASPREALGEILRAALLDERAHVRDHQGVPYPSVPGLTEQEQGLQAVGDRSGYTVYRGRGVPLYWLPDDGAVGVRPESLHKLVRAAVDPRIPPMTARTLPAYLVAEGLALPSHQKSGNRQKKIGGENMRLAYITPETLTLAHHENSEPPTATTATTATAQGIGANSNDILAQGTEETVTAQVRDGFQSPLMPSEIGRAHSENLADRAGSAGNSSARTELLPAACAGCGEALGRWLTDRGATRHVSCYADGDPEFTRVFGTARDPSAAAVAHALAPMPEADRESTILPVPVPAPTGAPDSERTTVVPASPQAAELPRRRWAVLALNDRAYAAGGEVITLAEGTLAAITNAGELAAVALVLGAERLYIPCEVREALGLPAEIDADPSVPRAGVLHIFTEATDPGQWDIWPGEPVGLAGWMDVYRVPRTLHQGAALVFPEWLANTPALGELHAPELARAVELVHLSTTHRGEGRGGVEFHRSPATTFGRLLGKAASASRKGRPEPVEMPSPYERDAKRPRNAPAALRAPGNHEIRAAEVPEGWTVARLDVRSCFASAVSGTDFGIGNAEHRKGGDLTKEPGAFLVRVPAEASAHPTLMPFGARPNNGRATEVLCWLDGHAARWLAECGVPVEVIESWTWPERQRVFDSVSQRLGEARTRLEMTGDAPSLAAAAVVKGMANAFLGGRLSSDYGGARNRDDWQWRYDWWLTTRVQAEVRKQRNLLPGIKTGAFAVLGEQFVDSVFVAAPSLASIEAAPGTRKLPAVHGDRGKFKVESHALVTGELSVLLASQKTHPRERLAAIRAALNEDGE